MDVKTLRAEWVAALRSGEYHQGIGALYNPETGGHCCLGVAGRVIGKNEVNLVMGSGESYADIAKAYGLRNELGRYNEGEALYIHNDVYGLTFSQIADIIESEPEGLFID
jgi:hypothetical protein